MVFIREILYHVHLSTEMRITRGWLISIVYRYWRTRNVHNILNVLLTFEHSFTVPEHLKYKSNILWIFNVIWVNFVNFVLLSHTFYITIIVTHTLRISQSQSKIIKNFQFFSTNLYSTSYRGSTMVAFSRTQQFCNRALWLSAEIGSFI